MLTIWFPSPHEIGFANGELPAPATWDATVAAFFSARFSGKAAWYIARRDDATLLDAPFTDITAMRIESVLYFVARETAATHEAMHALLDAAGIAGDNAMVVDGTLEPDGLEALIIAWRRTLGRRTSSLYAPVDTAFTSDAGQSVRWANAAMSARQLRAGVQAATSAGTNRPDVLSPDAPNASA